ncbi:MAG: YhdP family protein [Steroidobacteraceae bacterium]
MSSERTYRLRRWLAGALIALVLLVVGVFVALNTALSRVPEYQARLQALVKEQTGLTIEFRRVDTSLHWYGPEVVFWGAVLRTPDQHVLASARRGAVSLSLTRSLFERRIVVGRISLDGPELGVMRTSAGKFQVIGFQSQDPDRPFDLSRLPEGRYRVRDARVRFVDEQHARQPWMLSKVALELRRSAGGLQVEGSSDLPAALGRALRFNLRLSGDLKRAQSWQTEAELHADSLQLARWRESVAPDAMRELNGIASLHVRSRWQGASLQDLTGTLDARDLVASLPSWSMPIPAAAPLIINSSAEMNAASVVHPPEQAVPQSPPPTKVLPARVSYDRLSAAIELRRIRNEWRLEVDKLDLGAADRGGKPARIDASWTFGERGLEAWDAKANRIALGPLWPLLGWLPEREDLARVRALELSGALNDVDVTYRRGAEQPTYHVQALLQDVKFAPVGRIPGLGRVTAMLDANERGGTLKLDRTPLTFQWPKTFREELALDSLDGELEWSRTPTGWLLQADQVDLANPHGRVEAHVKLAFPRDGSSPQIDLTAEAFDLDVHAAPRYLPANQFGDKTLEWLDRAFVAGHVPHATVKLSGATRQFPFRNGGGDFLAHATCEGFTLDYQPEWLPATEVNANVEFHNAGMRGELLSGRLGGIELERGTAEFGDFKQAVLVLKVRAHSDIDQAFRYLQTSPLAPSLGPVFMGLTGHGSGSYAADLTLPLKNLAVRHVEIDTTVANAWVDHDAIKKPAARVSGSLRVVNQQVHSGALRGQWLGGPVVVDIKPQGQVSMLEARGTLQAPELATLLRLPSGVHLLGDSAWSGYVQLGPRKSITGTAAHVALEMDGTTVELPVPLHKDAGDRRPLSADLELQESGAVVRATFGAARGVGRIAEDDTGWRFDRAGVRADGETPSLPAHTGVRLEGHVDTFILDDWLALQSPEGSGESKSGLKLSDVLRAANLEIGEFGLFGYRWRDVRGLLQAEERSWRVDVNAPQAAGRLQVPYSFAGGDVLTADLESLVLPARAATAEGEQASEETDPRRLPSLRAHVRNFAVEDHGMGELQLQLSRVPQGVHIDKAEVRGSSYEGEASGDWLLTPAGHLTTLDMLMASTDVRDTLTAFNYSPFMQAKHAEVKGRLSWPGGLSAKWLTRATGRLTIQADQGQLLKLEPGAGRVLGLFSLAALPRRLSLDFTDLTGAGLTFDTIHGDFDLHDGNAYTSNLIVSGPSTEIGLAGRTGLEAHDYDQTAVVTGKLGASLPVAGALAGGPAVAAAVLLFSQIFKEPLKGVTRGYYRITGSWEDPLVERVHGEQAKEAAETSRSLGDARVRAGASE